MKLALLACTFAVVIAVPATAAQVEGPAPDREITVIRDGLYRVRDGTRHTVFLVTPDGIILADPLSRDTSRWLPQEFATRFPGRTVRYVLHTHHHADRAEGAALFNNTAELIGHREFNGQFFRALQREPDVYRFVRAVETTYARRLSLGGSVVEMVSTGDFHSPDMIVLHFVNERIVFAADPPPVATVPFAFGATEPDEVFDWIQAVASLEFDTLLFSDGTSMTRSDFTLLAQYLDALRIGVVAGFERGEPLSRLRAGGFLGAYTSNPHYAARTEHVDAVYRAVHLVRIELTGIAAAHHDPRNPRAYCGTFSTCASGGVVPAGTGSIAMLIGRNHGLVFEITIGKQSWSARAGGAFAEEVVRRKGRAALLYRRTVLQSGGTSLALLGGASFTALDVRGMNHIAGLVVPVGGFHAIQDRREKLGVTLGSDLRHALGRRVSLVLPVRFNQISGPEPAYWNTFDLQMGVGISVHAVRRAN